MIMKWLSECNSPYTIERVVTKLYDIHGDEKPFNINVDEVTFIYNKDNTEFECTFIHENKVFRAFEVKHWIDKHFKYGEVIYELNEIDAVYWMSGCINIQDKVYEIVDRNEKTIYVRELDLA